MQRRQKMGAKLKLVLCLLPFPIVLLQPWANARSPQLVHHHPTSEMGDGSWEKSTYLAQSNRYLAIPEVLPQNIVSQVPQKIAQIVPQRVYLEFGRIALRHPRGWSGQLQRDTEDYYLGNTTGFTGRSGQVFMRVYEPVRILEIARVQQYNPSQAFEIYQRFLYVENGNIAVADAEVVKTDIGSRTFWSWVQRGRFDIVWTGFVNEYGVLNIISTGISSGELPRFIEDIYAVALTTTFIPPSPRLDNPEQAMARYFYTIASNPTNVRSHLCRGDRAIIDAADSLSGGRASGILADYFSLASLTNSANMSNLYYETKYFDGNRAIVRVSGNVSFRNANGQTSLIPYGKLGGNGGIFRLVREGGVWKTCQTAR